MNSEEIRQLMGFFSRQPDVQPPQLIETHISWVILTDTHAYKIKKPMQYSFLDFSTIEKRMFYCEKEIMLNGRLTDRVYLGVVPVRQTPEGYAIGAGEGQIIDYAVKMIKMDPGRRMDVLLREDKVSYADIGRLAEKIATFHRRAEVIRDKDSMDIPLKFADLAGERPFLIGHIAAGSYIEWAMAMSLSFAERHRHLVSTRLSQGFVRDCHGDLHTRNIFLLEEPQPFDCIEFNDDLRQTDVLNEIAFLCMDLEASGRPELSALFLTRYNEVFPVMRTPEEEMLFDYFKSYRANVRAKVNSYRAKSAETKSERDAALQEAERYLVLMIHYLEELQTKWHGQHTIYS